MLWPDPRFRPGLRREALASPRASDVDLELPDQKIEYAPSMTKLSPEW